MLTDSSPVASKRPIDTERAAWVTALQQVIARQGGAQQGNGQQDAAAVASTAQKGGAPEQAPPTTALDSVIRHHRSASSGSSSGNSVGSGSTARSKGAARSQQAVRIARATSAHRGEISLSSPVTDSSHGSVDLGPSDEIDVTVHKRDSGFSFERAAPSHSSSSPSISNATLATLPERKLRL